MEKLVADMGCKCGGNCSCGKKPPYQVGEKGTEEEKKDEAQWEWSEADMAEDCR